ncbi:MAG: hypothetical protein WAM69_08280 [Candidatus Sulfotelmatobacter sp.]
MSSGLKLAGMLVAGTLCLPITAPADTHTAHRVHRVKKPQLPPPLPSGPRGPVPQVPLDALPAVAPQVTYQDGLLTIVAENSTLGDILRGVRKHTAAEIDIPATASERVVTRLGPGPAREVMAELLNGSHFNYVLLGSPDNAKALVRVVLVAKTQDTPNSHANGAAPPPDAANVAADNPDADATDDSGDDTPDQGTAIADQETTPDQPGVKTPQQLLQEMQQRQMLMQERGRPGFPSTPGAVPQAPPDPQDPQ